MASFSRSWTPELTELEQELLNQDSSDRQYTDSKTANMMTVNTPQVVTGLKEFESPSNKANSLLLRRSGLANTVEMGITFNSTTPEGLGILVLRDSAGNSLSSVGFDSEKMLFDGNPVGHAGQYAGNAGTYALAKVSVDTNAGALVSGSQLEAAAAGGFYDTATSSLSGTWVCYQKLKGDGTANAVGLFLRRS